MMRAWWRRHVWLRRRYYQQRLDAFRDDLAREAETWLFQQGHQS